MSFQTSKGRILSLAVRTHILYKDLLTANEYWTMLNLKSTTEIAGFLKNTSAYSKPLEQITSATVHRVDIEIALKKALLDEADLFMSYLHTGSRKKFFASWLSWFEAEHIKNIFRFVKFSHFDINTIKMLIYRIPGSDIAYEKLLNCTSYAEILETLRTTKYYTVLKDPVKKLIKEEETSLFHTELAIDNFVEAELFKNLGDLNEEERYLLTPIFGERIDLLNLSILHRCMYYYSMIPEETLGILLPVTYRINSKDFMVMANIKAPEERYKFLHAKFPKFTKLFIGSINKSDRELIIETLCRRYNYFQCIKLFRTGSPGFHTLIAYFMLKLHELEDVIHIIEDVRYSRNPSVSAKYLIKPIISGGESLWQ